MRQRTVKQCTTKHNAGTLPLNLHAKELSIGRRVTFENASQDSEYDSGSDEEERESAENQAKEKIPLTLMRSTFYQDEFVLALAELFLGHIEL